MTTIGVAEYRALHHGLFLCACWGIIPLTAYSDSNYIVQQVNGLWRCRAHTSVSWNALTRKWLEQLREKGTVQVRHTPRATNAMADYLAGLAIDRDHDEDCFDPSIFDHATAPGGVLLREEIPANLLISRPRSETTLAGVSREDRQRSHMERVRTDNGTGMWYHSRQSGRMREGGETDVRSHDRATDHDPEPARGEAAG